MNVDVGVCTFRRPAVAETLASIAAQALPESWRVRVIVADNDEPPSAEPVVRAAATRHGLDVAYVHAPARNISVARNACLDAATAQWFAYIDDDETAAPGWLAALIAEAERGGWDAVLGPVKAIYGADAPAWLAGEDFHSTAPVRTGGRILKGYAGNVLMRRSAVVARGLRFDEALGRQGGEDDDFFYRLTDAGGTIGYAEDALAFEPVPAHRASLPWLLKRSFRTGQTHGARLSHLHRGPARLAQMGLAAAKGGVCLTGAAMSALSPGRRSRWLVRGSLHAGAAARLAGVRELQLY
ncbi:MAG: glycosyltransferase family 2 protein [Alphaproteobacteria bacterium]|nr:glycosyltransferase family 2 protein [Alphaproteobacteria bacterium]